MKHRLLLFVLLTISFLTKNLDAANLVVDNQTFVVDANSLPYSRLTPGDTIFLQAGMRSYLLIRNFQGTASKPFVFINKGGLVTIDTDHIYGISIQNCRYFHFTGNGYLPYFYGIEIRRVSSGAGIGIGLLSSDFEIDHISIQNVPIGGLYAKTDPECGTPSTREKFTQFNTIIHDNYIENAGNEGLYIGSTKYTGQTVTCGTRDTLLMPSLLDGVKIYNNIIKYSGWDGIQISSAFNNCQVFDNIILFDSQAEYVNQMSGIMLGGGSKCDCYNNYIADGKGIGIENHGLGGNRMFNNLIVNPGISYAPGDFSASKMKYGIFVTDNSALKDSSFTLLNNTIINPKSDGIRFSSTKSNNNLIASNAIINPGNFDYYESGNTQFKGVDSYVMVTDKSSKVLITNNYFSRNISSAGFNSDFSLKSTSPLIDAGYSKQPRISFDFKHTIRKTDNLPDIGAFEFDPQTGIIQTSKEVTEVQFYPNPVSTELNIRFRVDKCTNSVFSIYDIKGYLLNSKRQFDLPAGEYVSNVQLSDLPKGIYLYTFKINNKTVSGKFVKVE